jgi:alpha-1,6-mannosyltransferase
MPQSKHVSPGMVAFFFIGCVGYLALGYVIPRFESLELVVIYTLLYGFYLYFLFYLKGNARTGVRIAIIFRLLLIFSLPTLSTDYFRFLWDGQLLAEGINPFIHPPEFFANDDFLSGINLKLYHQLSYKIYHSMYPPFTQVTGWIAATIGGDSILGGVIVLRVLVIVADTLNIWLIQKVLKLFGINSNRVLLYALNPLIILELTGNLHHEVYVILFTLLAVYFLEKKKLISSAVLMGMAVLSKLLPLIFLPLLFKRLGLKRAIQYIVISGGVVLIGFLPFLNQELVSGFISSGSLYFQKLEFNASVYFLVREVGFWVKGYNIIQTAGIWLGIITTILILIYAFFERQEKGIMESFMWVWLIYVSFATTLHPWYIAPVIAFSIFTNYRFAVVWGYLIFLTYTGYFEGGYNETYGIFILEYSAVFGMLIYEWYKESRQVVN